MNASRQRLGDRKAAQRMVPTKISPKFKMNLKEGVDRGIISVRALVIGIHVSPVLAPVRFDVRIDADACPGQECGAPRR